MNISDFLMDYFKDIKYDKNGNGYDLYLPFMLYNDDHTISVHIEENKEGYYDIHDNGHTLKYLTNIGADITKYENKVELICDLFAIKVDGELVKGIIGYGSNQVYIQLYNFLQGLTHLSTIKYLD